MGCMTTTGWGDMHRVILMLGVLGLVACQMTTPATPLTGPIAVPSPIVGDVVAAAGLPRDDAPLAALDPVVAPVIEAPVDVPPEDVVPEAEKTPEQIKCEKKGGSWSRIGKTQARTCVQRTRDAGKQCKRDRDCEGVCLARSSTCAPVNPLFGCNEVVQDDGRRMTLCLN
jgi:hypothetical protein